MKPSERITEIANSNAQHNTDGTPILGQVPSADLERKVNALIQYLDEQDGPTHGHAA